jgi:MoaA/NifB/PqqE/SkfB family radical SAM enzyme
MRPGAVPDLDRRPLVVAWEVTRACGYRCLHCRADAQPRPAPGELTDDEGRALVDDLARFGDTTLVLTGGDPMLRPDLVELAERASERGLRVAITPSATGRVTTARLAALRAAGVGTLAISLDGAEAASHDAMRGVAGSHARSLRILERAREQGFALQVNSTITRHNAHAIPALADQAVAAGAAVWSAFFLVPTGRGRAGDMLDAEGHERALRELVGLRRRLPLHLKVTAAPAVRRVEEQMAWEGLAPAPRAPLPVNDGRGFMFISHDGRICPSGFLPIAAGEVRSASAVDVYRRATLFRRLREPTRLGGRCGACRWRDVCGGSRARAFALTGNPFASEPTCAHRTAMERKC